VRPLTTEELKPAKVRGESIALLNQLLADTMTLRDLYKKRHWQVSGPTLYRLHLLFDKHYQEQADAVTAIAGRIQLLGGISIAMAADVGNRVQFSSLLEAHETIIKLLRTVPKGADGNTHPGTNDHLISDVLRLHELQTCFLAAHLGELPIARSDAAPPQKTCAVRASA
jgi:starvation-inducible DNA-binding protein